MHLPPQDLCERHEKGVLHKHQRALHKYSLMKRQMMSATVQSREPDSVEQLESRIVEVVLARGVGGGGVGGLGLPRWAGLRARPGGPPGAGLPACPWLAPVLPGRRCPVLG